MANNPQLPYSSLIKEFGLKKVMQLSKKYRSVDLETLECIFSLLQFQVVSSFELPF